MISSVKPLRFHPMLLIDLLTRTSSWLNSRYNLRTNGVLEFESMALQPLSDSSLKIVAR